MWVFFYPDSLENRIELILDVGAYPKRWKQLLSWMINLLGECFFIIRVTTNIYYILYVCLWRTTFPSLKGPLRFMSTTLFSIFPGLYYTKMDFSMSSFLLLSLNCQFFTGENMVVDVYFFILNIECCSSSSSRVY